MSDPEDDLKDPELQRLLRDATAGDRPPEALVLRIRSLCREEPRRAASPSGEFWRELFPRLITLAGVLSLLVGALSHFSFARGVERLASASLPDHVLTDPLVLSVATLFALVSLVVLFTTGGGRGGLRSG